MNYYIITFLEYDSFSRFISEYSQEKSPVE